MTAWGHSWRGRPAHTFTQGPSPFPRTAR